MTTDTRMGEICEVRELSDVELDVVTGGAGTFNSSVVNQSATTTVGRAAGTQQAQSAETTAGPDETGSPL